ncbi:MAG: hypothetical protein VCF25_31260 [Candidatus Poribacteria bacterium]
MTTTKKKLASIAISVQPRCFHTLTHLASPAMMGDLTKDFLHFHRRYSTGRLPSRISPVTPIRLRG